MADTGALKVTWSRGDLESTFIVNSGSVQIGHNLFRITEGSDIATDLKNFVPAFYFTTSEAGTYTINWQTITTSAANLALTATDDQMVFKTSNNVVGYDVMTFTGNGNVSLKLDIVVLGAGVKATGFADGKSFMLAEAGDVTADARIFTLEKLYLEKDGQKIPISMNVSVAGVQDGFIFSRTPTEESEEYIEAYPPMVGSIFNEKFIAVNDNSYRTTTDPIGLEKVIGVSDGRFSINGSAGMQIFNDKDISISANRRGFEIFGLDSGASVSVSAAGGDDTISLSGSALIEYTADDGNDFIDSFNSKSTLSISGEKYSSSKSGSDVIISVGDDSITLSGTSSANIIGIRDIPDEEVAQLINAKEIISLASGN